MAQLQRRRYRSLPLNHQRRQRRVTHLSMATLLGLIGGTLFLEAFQTASSYLEAPAGVVALPIGQVLNSTGISTTRPADLQAANGRPQLSPLPTAEEVWECEVVVIGGSLGGVAAASHAMQAGAQTCLMELTPWLGGQVSAQGVSAIDESRAMQSLQNYSESWRQFKRLIRAQTMPLPSWTGLPSPQLVYQTNSCWVGNLCFLPRAGAMAARQWLQQAAAQAPGSRWATSTAFKGAAFNPSGRRVTAIYGVKRIPRNPDYAPRGRLSQELYQWYSWSDSDTFNKIPVRLQPPPGQRMVVIDATDTGEFVGWAQLPHRIGSDAQSLLGEPNAPSQSNPDCTQAFTFPFVLSIRDDQQASLKALRSLTPGISRQEHRQIYGMEGFPMFHDRGLFNYRRIVSQSPGAAAVSQSAPGEMTLVNWNLGNDWNIMDEPLILTQNAIAATGQQQNWMGGLSVQALKNAENHALLFAEWLMEQQARPDLPLALEQGSEAPLGTASGLSMVPYIREGRRIVGRPAYGQDWFMMHEADLRRDYGGGRDFSATAVGLAHYDIDIHGCRYRNWQPSYEAARASVNEAWVQPLQIPLEALIPVGVDNVLVGGKAIAVSHIVNATTRVHAAEWSIGAAAGTTAGWLLRYGQPDDLTPAQILVTGQITELQQYLRQQGLRFQW